MLQPPFHRNAPQSSAAFSVEILRRTLRAAQGALQEKLPRLLHFTPAMMSKPMDDLSLQGRKHFRQMEFS